MKVVSDSLRRLRLVMPPDASLVGFAVVFLVAEVPFRLLERWNGGSLPHPARFVLCFASLVVGFQRATRFHPYYHPSYHQWLARTPWTRGRPLPGGPVFPTPEDLLIVGALVLLGATQPDLRPESVATRYLMGYTAGLTIPMWWAGAVVHGHLCLFGLGLIARLWRTPYAFPTALGLLPLALAGLWRTLGAVSRRIDAKVPQLPTPSTEPTEVEAEPACGWPFDQLSPKIVPASKWGVLDRILAAQTLGWLVYCVCGIFESGDGRMTVLVCALGATCVALIPGRFLMYRSFGAPPISFWGRLATFRPIIPGYDQILFAPAITLAAVGIGYFELRRLDLDREIVISALVTIAWLTALNTGPSLTSWRLAGKMRLVPKQAKTGEFVKTG